MNQRYNLLQSTSLTIQVLFLTSNVVKEFNFSHLLEYDLHTFFLTFKQGTIQLKYVVQLHFQIHKSHP